MSKPIEMFVKFLNERKDDIPTLDACIKNLEKAQQFKNVLVHMMSSRNPDDAALAFKIIKMAFIYAKTRPPLMKDLIDALIFAIPTQNEHVLQFIATMSRHFIFEGKYQGLQDRFNHFLVQINHYDSSLLPSWTSTSSNEQKNLSTQTSAGAKPHII